MIKPTIGRVVLYWSGNAQIQPYPAFVAFVHSDTMINVGGFNDGGTPFGNTSVPLLQDDQPAPASGPYAEWMPYQKAVASAGTCSTDSDKVVQHQSV